MSDRILYVDDDQANLKVLVAACAEEFVVVTAASGAEALEILRREEVAVLLVDQRMPHMTGVELLEIAAREYPETIRILITAYADLSAAVDAINRGRVRRYIRKPWDPDELRATLREALDTYGLKRRVEELERRLMQTERIYALGVVAASLAHELRTPLTVLVGSLDMIRADLPGLVAHIAATRGAGSAEHARLTDLAELLESARGAAERIAEIVAGIDLGQRRAQSTKTADLCEVVRVTLACLRSALRRRATLRLDLSPVPRVAGSPAALSQVTLNLVVNALEALPADGGNQGHTITVQLRQEDNLVRLDVDDTGPGMPREVLSHVFEPFFTTKEDGGTGLGLAVSRRIIEELRGTITVSSEIGRGTRFTVRLPVAPAATP
jgi:two-component system sensor histidine kinase HydH